MKRIIYFLFLLVLGLPIVFAEDVEIINVTTFGELKVAVENISPEIIIELKNDIDMESKLVISSGKKVTINGKNFSLIRTNIYVGAFFEVANDSTFKIDSLKIEGNASGWKVDFDNSYFQKANNKGVVYTPVILGEDDIVGNDSLIVNHGEIVLQNVSIKNVRATMNGAVIRGEGNNTIRNSNIEKVFSTKSGGAMYVTGGETKIVSSTFSDCMVGLEKASTSGGAVYISNSTLNVSDNSLFQNNYTSGSGGAIYLHNTNVDISDSILKGNKTGNDGAAIVMSEGTETLKVKYENTIFEDNFGLANTGQSLGIIYINSWKTKESENEEDYIRFLNVVFRNNKIAAGAIADLNADDSTILFDNCKIYDNDTNGAAAIFTQGARFIIRNTDIYNNYGGAYGVVRVKYGPASLYLDNVNIYNNETPNYGGALAVSYGDVVVKNSNFYNNKTGGNGTIYVNSVDNTADAVTLILENTIIKDNETDGYGGGIYIEDAAGLYTKLEMDDKTRLYGNKSNLAGDDFVYVNKNELASAEDLLLLNNALEYDINGIDNWYHDNENNRYNDMDIPDAYEKDPETGAMILYLKAAGEVELSYDLNGGLSSNKYEVEYTKYGSSFNVTDDKPSIENGEFIGWNTKPDGSGYWYYDTDTYKGEHGKVLYAQYKINKVENFYDEINPDTSSGDFIIVLVILVIVSMTILVLFTNSYVKLI